MLASGQDAEYDRFRPAQRRFEREGKGRPRELAKRQDGCVSQEISRER